MEAALSKSEREALKAIYRRTRDGSDAHTGDLADSLGVTPGTVTAIVKRLADRGLADHKPYKGVELTVTGRRAAVAAIRRHRIVERFLCRHARLRLERGRPPRRPASSTSFPRRSRTACSWPSTGRRPARTASRSPSRRWPRSRRCRRSTTSSRATRRWWPSRLGGPGGGRVPRHARPAPRRRVQVKEKHPFDGPLVLVVDGEDRTVGEKVARQIFVRKGGGQEVHKPRKRRSRHDSPVARS